MTHTAASPDTFDNLVIVFGALGQITLRYLLPALILTVVVMAVRHYAAAPRFTVSSPGMPEYTESYRTRAQALQAARELTEEMGWTFLVDERV
jgi:hypothetical protein